MLTEGEGRKGKEAKGRRECKEGGGEKQVERREGGERRWNEKGGNRD